ncbi:MAG: metallophosphoesterase [bacterium]|nr:metallophosphoesterase [bacterium]
MQISEGIKIVDLALFIEKYKALVIADIHIGFEEALNKQGVFVPRFQFKDVLKRLEKIIQKTKPSLIIINGDIKHEFGTISEQEWRETLKIIDFLTRKSKVVLIKGNHDSILGPIAEKRNVEIKDSVILGDACILHGHKIPKLPKIKRIIIGHEHPAVALWEHPRSELFKCFLKGTWKRKELIVLPSFNLVTEGTDVLKESLLSPFLKNIGNFEVFIVEDKVYRFGRIKDLR